MKIAIVGAGVGGTKLIELFQEISGIELLTVVDKNMQSQGIEVARKHGVKCTANIGDIDSQVDMIIDATGNANVLDQIKRLYEGKKRIVESDVAQMMMFIVDKQVDMRKRLNFQLEEINSTSTKLHDEMNKIVSNTEDLNVINKALTNSSEQSRHFIELTDEMTRAVNKITQSIKILGLNANIEAARAGEHGRGFSVVATEVQKMSDSTSDFAKQISELLTSLRLENESILVEISKLNDISSEQQTVTTHAKEIVDQLKNI